MTFAEADAAYPFDRTADSRSLRGLELMRCFDDPKMRRNVFEVMNRIPIEQEAPAGYRPYRAPETTDDSERRFP